MRIFIALLIIALTSGHMGTAADARGNREAGETLANDWCATCHALSDDGPQPDVAPPFSALAQDERLNDDYLRGWLTAPHGAMQTLELSRQQIEDVIAYLRDFESQGQ